MKVPSWVWGLIVGMFYLGIGMGVAKWAWRNNHSPCSSPDDRWSAADKRTAAVIAGLGWPVAVPILLIDTAIGCPEKPI